MIRMNDISLLLAVAITLGMTIPAKAAESAVALPPASYDPAPESAG